MEYLRVISCILVILGHIANWYMREYPNLPMNSYIGSVLYNGICRISVPIFFMISGSLLLEQPTDFKKNNYRIFSFFIKTVIWTAIYIVWDYFYLGDGYSLQSVLATPVRAHFWFMYVMLGIYITVPLWQKLVSNSSKAFILYFSIFMFAILILSTVAGLFNMTINYPIPLFGSSVYACYFIMGYIIRHHLDDININKWLCVGIIIICIAATDILTLYNSVKYDFHIEKFSDFKSAFIGICAMLIFYLFMKTANSKPCKIISVISKHSFNIYMTHVFFLDILQQNIDITKVSSWYGTPIFLVIMLLLSLAFSWFLEKAKGKNQPYI